jgi:hypothetical protein
VEALSDWGAEVGVGTSSGVTSLWDIHLSGAIFQAQNMYPQVRGP